MGALSGRADPGLAPQGLDKILRVRIRVADPERAWLGKDPWTPLMGRRGRS